MNFILSTAIIVTTLTSLFLVIRYRNLPIEGSVPVPLVTFLAILFTSGLDVGLIMFPLVDFQSFAADPEYAFANPLALEFGFWGFLVWGFYFLTTFYFCVIEPKLKLFEIPVIKLANNFCIIAPALLPAIYSFTTSPITLPVFQIASGSAGWRWWSYWRCCRAPIYVLLKPSA